MYIKEFKSLLSDTTLSIAEYRRAWAIVDTQFKNPFNLYIIFDLKGLKIK